VCPNDDTLISSAKFIEAFPEISYEIPARTRPEKNKKYYALVLNGEIHYFDKDEWDDLEFRQRLDWDD
jgi:hypothetical protein